MLKIHRQARSGNTNNITLFAGRPAIRRQEAVFDPIKERRATGRSSFFRELMSNRYHELLRQRAVADVGHRTAAGSKDICRDVTGGDHMDEGHGRGGCEFKTIRTIVVETTAGDGDRSLC